MALVIADRVFETTTTTGTGAIALGGAVSGFRTFGSGVGNNNTTYYTIAGQTTSEWEVGLGTLDGTSANLTRTTVLSSSNAGLAVNFSAGIKNVFGTYTATKGVYLDASNNVSALGTVASGTWNGTTIGTAYGGTGSTSTTYCSLTTNVTGILPAANGGTSNGFTAFTGPTTATKTFTLPDSNSTIVVQGGALGTPSSGTVTNLTGTASININGTVGATTPTTGSFTTLAATSTVDTSALARNSGLTSNTTVSNTTTYTTGGITLTNQTAAAGSVWRVRAFGQFTAANSGTARNAQIACFWGTTQLTAITPTVLVNTAQTTQWQVEFVLAATSTTAIWTTGSLMSRVVQTTSGANPMDNATPASTTVTAGAQTLDLRVSMSASVAGDSWIVQQVVMERLK